MSKAKHTKGKWVVDDDCVITTLPIVGDIICEAPEWSYDSMKNWDANARLIAEAPTMYELLRQYAETMGVYTPQLKQFNSKVEELIKKI